MKVRFHGVRGSNPTSVTPARVEEICKFVWDFGQKNKIKTWKELKEALEQIPRSKYQVFGGATTCLELKSSLTPMPIFFDAGTGISTASKDRASALSHRDFKEGHGKAAIFLTHTHLDHVIGIPTLEQIYKEGNEIHFYGVHKELSKRIELLFQEELFPVPFRVVEKNFLFHQIPLNAAVRLGRLTISHYAQTHPGGSFAYRVDDGKNSFIFATDTSLKHVGKNGVIPGQNFYSNTDALIVDAQFSPEDIISREDWGHAEIYSVVDFAVRENAKRLYLFHHNPSYSDAQLDAQYKRALKYHTQKFGKKHPMEIHMTVEGQEIKI